MGGAWPARREGGYSGQGHMPENMYPCSQRVTHPVETQPLCYGRENRPPDSLTDRLYLKCGLVEIGWRAQK